MSDHRIFIATKSMEPDPSSEDLERNAPEDSEAETAGEQNPEGREEVREVEEAEEAEEAEGGDEMNEGNDEETNEEDGQGNEGDQEAMGTDGPDDLMRLMLDTSSAAKRRRGRDQ